MACSPPPLPTRDVPSACRTGPPKGAILFYFSFSKRDAAGPSREASCVPSSRAPARRPHRRQGRFKGGVETRRRGDGFAATAGLRQAAEVKQKAKTREKWGAKGGIRERVRDASVYVRYFLLGKRFTSSFLSPRRRGLTRAQILTAIVAKPLPSEGAETKKKKRTRKKKGRDSRKVKTLCEPHHHRRPSSGRPVRPARRNQILRHGCHLPQNRRRANEKASKT